MTFQIKAEMLLGMSNWEKNLKKTSKQAEGFGKSMKTISNGVKAAWAGVALLGLNAIGDALVDITKAAAADGKSMALLNKQMDNSWHATKKTKEEMSKYVDTVSNLTGIQDDLLRPALSKIIGVTKNATKAQKYFSMALDVSAGTGKDVNVVSQAFAKFLGGNSKALDKLVPGLKNAGDKMKFLRDHYKGMAAVAGNNDPFARITVVMDNFKEKLGTAFLPVVQKFADWLSSPEAQTALDDIAKKVQDFGAWFMSPEGQKTFDGWMADLKTMIELAGDFLGMVKDVAALLKGKRLDHNGSMSPTNTQTGKKINMIGADDKSKWAGVGEAFKNALGGLVVQTNIDPITGKSVTTLLQTEARTRGIPLSKLLK